ncbi:MAG: PIN domain-containing protein [Cyanobacteria bacterium J06635_1]
MSKLFIDTWGWLTLHNKREPRHTEVVDFYRAFRTQRGIIYTTDYVLDETYTLMFKRLPANHAKAALEGLFSAFSQDGFKLFWITPERFAQAQTLRTKFLDKPDISFTDLTSMLVMMEYKIQSVLTEDSHFDQVNLGFQRLP